MIFNSACKITHLVEFATDIYRTRLTANRFLCLQFAIVDWSRQPLSSPTTPTSFSPFIQYSQ